MVNCDMPGENGATLEQLAYSTLQKIAKQTASLDQNKSNFRRNKSVTKGF